MSDNPFETGDSGDESKEETKSVVEEAGPSVVDDTLDVPSVESDEVALALEVMEQARNGRNIGDIPVSPNSPDPYWAARDKYQQALHKAKG